MRVYNKHCSRIAGIDPGRSGEITEAQYRRDPWAFVIEDQNGSESPSESNPAQNETGSGAPRRAHQQSPAPSSDA